MEIDPVNQKFNYSLFSPTNIIAVYTVLSVLNKMKNKLGLEAMLEYLDSYLQVLAKDNPKMKFAVARALELIDIEKIYREAQLNNEK